MLTLFIICVGIIVYTYMGYPIAIALLARVARYSSFRVTELAPKGKVSVVLVVRNESARIAARIDNLRAQRPPGIVDDIVVVSDGSDDSTDALLETMSELDSTIRVFRQWPSKGKAAGVTLGVAKTRNEIVVFADARQDFGLDTVARFLSRFSDDNVGAVAGELRFRSSDGVSEVADSVGAYWKYEVWIRRNEATIDSAIGCAGSVYAARRTLIRPVPQGLILDDVWVPMHVVMQGKRVVYEENAFALDSPSDNLDREFGRKVRTLAGNVQLVLAAPKLMSPYHNRLWWMFWSHKLLRLVVPYALVGALLTNMTMPELGFGIVLFAQCLFYFLGALGYLTSGRPGFWRLCAAIRIFLTINVAGVVGTAYALAGRGQVLWRSPSELRK